VETVNIDLFIYQINIDDQINLMSDKTGHPFS